MPGKRARVTKKSDKDKNGRPAKIKRVKEVTFDEDARAEFLTGFSKRKKQREAAVRTKAILRDREELKESRKAIREERKERAASNVKNAKALYGGAEGSDEDGKEDGASESDDEEAKEAGPTAAYESSELVTTVHVEPFRLSRSPSPIPLPSTSSTTASAPKKPSVEASHKKRVRNKPAFRPKMTRADKKERATGGKKKVAGFLKGNVGTKGKGNKG